MRNRRGPTVNVQRRGPGLIGTMARTAVVAGTATATVGATKKMMGGGQQAAAQQAAAEQAAAEQQMAEMQAQQAAFESQQAAQVAPAADSLDAQLVQIQKLAVLKEQGLLTEEEFTAKKAQILGI
ncbi:MAG: SHOCT domain-containing protein [Caldilineaceae bacterium]|nr:SHOCT domain-containing protein [Caldilineaceae bacterium]MCB9158794.1 SHOCT domain-containing protein [Caldilineaceae bacterium]